MTMLTKYITRNWRIGQECMHLKKMDYSRACVLSLTKGMWYLGMNMHAYISIHVLCQDS